MCQSPRCEVRRLGAKALASLSWDGHVDSRTLGTGVRDQWRYWVKIAVSREEEYIRRETESFKFEPYRGRTKSDATARIELLAHTAIESDAAFRDDVEGPSPGTAVLRQAIQVSEGDETLSARMILSRFAVPSTKSTPAREVAVARRQWALRRRRACEGPNRANMRILAAAVPTTTATWLGLRMLEAQPVETEVEKKIRVARARPFDTESKSHSPETPPLVSTLLTLIYERDQDCVLAAATGLAAASFDSENAMTLGRIDGIIKAVVFLAKHENPEVVALACDVRFAALE